MDTKEKRQHFTVVDRDYTTSGPPPFDAEHERLMREEFARRVKATQNGDTGDITRGK